MEYFQGCCGAVAALLWSSPSQAKEVVPNGLLFAARPPNGLRAAYYQNTTLSGTSLVRVDPNVNFNWGTGSPDSVIPVDWFSARWEGTVAPRYSGSYTFYTQADDGVRLWVNGQLLVDDWNYHPTQEHSGTITLSAGQRYSIRLEYVEATEGANVALLWSSASQAKEIVPNSQLFVPTNSGEYRPAGTNQYVTANGQGPGYDARFNLTSYDGATFTYDAANHLMTAQKGTNNGSFVYDGLGRCVKRTISGQSLVYAYDGWKPVFEHEWNGGWYAWNVYGTGEDEILWRYQATSNVGNLRYHSDIHGNVTALLDWYGNGIEKYTYDVFGKPTITDWNGNVRAQSAYANRFMFQGREYFAEFGIYYYRNRWYQPELGRFLQADPKGFDAGDFNLFRYCGDDPVDHSDPMGLDILLTDIKGNPLRGVELQDAQRLYDVAKKQATTNRDASVNEAMAKAFNAVETSDKLHVKIAITNDKGYASDQFRATGTIRNGQFEGTATFVWNPKLARVNTNGTHRTRPGLFFCMKSQGMQPG